jgi:hypothetical protein
VSGACSHQDEARGSRTNSLGASNDRDATLNSDRPWASTDAPRAVSLERSLQSLRHELPAPLAWLSAAAHDPHINIYVEHKTNGVVACTFLNAAFQHHVAALGDFAGRNGLVRGPDGAFHHPHVLPAGVGAFKSAYVRLRSQIQACPPSPATSGAAWPGCTERLAIVSARIPLWHRCDGAGGAEKGAAEYDGCFTMVTVDGPPGSGFTTDFVVATFVLSRTQPAPAAPQQPTFRPETVCVAPHSTAAVTLAGGASFVAPLHPAAAALSGSAWFVSDFSLGAFAPTDEPAV